MPLRDIGGGGRLRVENLIDTGYTFGVDDTQEVMVEQQKSRRSFRIAGVAADAEFIFQVAPYRNVDPDIFASGRLHGPTVSTTGSYQPEQVPNYVGNVAGTTAGDVAAGTALINNVANDNVLSRSEKQDVVNEWARIQVEYSALEGQAAGFSLANTTGTPRNNLTVAYNALSTYLAGLTGWNTLGTDTAIVGTTFSARFQAYYSAVGPATTSIQNYTASVATWSGTTGPGKPADNADVTSTVAAIGDANRVHYSRYERGTIGWGSQENIGVTPTLSTGTGSGRKYIRADATFTANSQCISIGTETTITVYPVMANERVFVAAGLEISGGFSGLHSWSLSIGWLNSAGAEISRTTVAQSTGSQSYNTRSGGFATAPATAVACFLRFLVQNNTGGAGAIFMSMVEPMVCSAGASQTSWPAFNPGPWSEQGATLGADMATNVTNRTQDYVLDGATYGRVLGTRVNGGRPTVDFSESIHTGKNLDNIGDGSTYGRVLGTRVSIGRPIMDFSEGIHANQNLVNNSNVGAYAALGDANRVRYSLLEAGTVGWDVLYNPASLSTSIGTTTLGGRPIFYTQATWTGPNQFFQAGTTYGTSAKDRIPVTGGQTIFAGCRINFDYGSVGGSTWLLFVNYYDAGGTYISSSPYLATGTNDPGGVRQGGFDTAPSNAVTCILVVQINNGTTGTNHGTVYIAEPQVCAAGVNQTAFPAFTPGPGAEPAATKGATSGPGGNLIGDVDGNGRPNVDFAQPHYNKTLTNVADDGNYRKVGAGHVSSAGVPLLSVAGSGKRLGDQRNMPAISAMNLRYKVLVTSTLSSTGVLTYSSTAGTPATATVSCPALTVYIGGATVTYNTMTSASVTGTGGTTVTYYAYVDDPSYAGGTPSSGLQIVPASSANSIYQNDGRVYIGTIDVTFATSGSSSGSGGTGGGGTCVHEDAWVELEGGCHKMAKQVVPGDRVRVLSDDRTHADCFEEVESNEPSVEQGYEIRAADGCRVLVSASTPITLRDGSIISVHEIEAHELPTLNKGEFSWQKCSVHSVGVIAVRKIKVHQKTYAAGVHPGRSILTHNPKP